jgi:chromosomal replication initiation ATPase DnaA
MGYSVFNMASMNYALKKFHNDKVGLVCEVYSCNRESFKDKIRTIRLSKKDQIELCTRNGLLIEWIYNPYNESIQTALMQNINSVVKIEPSKINQETLNYFIDSLEKTNINFNHIFCSGFSFKSLTFTGKQLMRMLSIISYKKLKYKTGDLDERKLKEIMDLNNWMYSIQDHPHYKQDARLILEIFKTK